MAKKKRKPRKALPKVLPIKAVKMTKKALKELGIEARPSWWLKDVNNTHCELIGPYESRAEAIEARVGILKFWKSNKWLLKGGDE